MRILNKVDYMLDIVKDKSLFDKTLSFILDSSIADLLTDKLLDFVPLCEEDTEADVIKVLDNNSFVTVTVVRYDNSKEELFVDPLIHSDGEQYYDSSDLYFVQDEVSDVVEFDKIADGMVYIIGEEGKINGIIKKKEEDDAYLDDCVCDYFNGLAKSTSEVGVHCYTKDFFKEIYGTAYHQAIIDIEG